MIDESIINKTDCMGCYACYNICPIKCITMEVDREGFWYPKIDRSICVGCGLCDEVCPSLNKKEVNNKPQAYACINKDEKIRSESSSGGMFTIIAEYVFENGGVVFGVGFNDLFEVEHSYVERKEELNKFRGSKYVQSKVGDTYKQAKAFLENKRLVLYSGTPCQISGLHSYLGSYYENLITIDLICHGVPSPSVWSKYVKFREINSKSKVKEISFRKKTFGWKKFSEYFLFENDFVYLESLDKDLYLQSFLKNICLRPSCYYCKFKSLHRESDITLADFWGIEHINPKMDDDKGTSLIFLNSQKGIVLFSKIKKNMKFEKVDIDEAVQYNVAAIKASNNNPKRNLFMNNINSMEFDKLVIKYCTPSLLFRIKNKAKRTVKQIFFK